MKLASGEAPPATVQVEVTQPNQEFLRDLENELQNEFDNRLQFSSQLEFEAPGAPTGEYLLIALKSLASAASGVALKEVYEYIKEEYGAEEDSESNVEQRTIYIENLQINTGPPNKRTEDYFDIEKDSKEKENSD